MMRLRITSWLMMIVVMIWHQNQISPMHLSNSVSEPNYRECMHRATLRGGLVYLDGLTYTPGITSNI